MDVEYSSARDRVTTDVNKYLAINKETSHEKRHKHSDTGWSLTS